MTTTRPRRPAVTLVEVLVTIFIMGLGMLALLTLFPVGAVSMARALKDDRAASAAVTADGIAWIGYGASPNPTDLRNDPLITTSPTNAYTDPFGTTIKTGSGTSYGVYVDPQGLAGGVYGSTIGAMGGGVSTGLPRRSMSLQNFTLRNPTSPPNPLTVAEAARWCTLLDDIQFKNTAVPDTTSGGVTRYGAYTWAWLLRQQQAGIMTSVDCWVIVYRNRDTSQATGETTYSATGTQLDTSVTVNSTGLNLRTGSWVLDTTPASNGAVPGYFYRVTDWYVDNSSGTTVLQLENALQTNCTALTVMEGVVEVFYRGSSPMNQ